MEIFKIVILSVSGLLLFVVGTMRLVNPIKQYLKGSGIALNQDVSLLNEVRGVSAVMLLGGLIMLSGTIVPELSFTSHIVATLLFIGFAIGRTVSYNVDGKPNKLIVQGLVSEIVLGGLNVFCVISILV
jgi:hypothetical protein